MSSRPSRYQTRELLSPRQREVISLIARGRTNAEIAEELRIGRESVKTHVSEILAKFGVASREEAVVAWRESRSAGAAARRMAESLAVFASGKALVAAVMAVVVAGSLGIAVVLANRGSNDTPASPATTATSIATATATPSPTAEPLTGSYPPGTRTGDVAVDAILAAVEARDADQLYELVEYVEVPCSQVGEYSWGGGTACDTLPPEATIKLLPTDGIEPAAFEEGPDIVFAFQRLFDDTEPADLRVRTVFGGVPSMRGSKWRIVFDNGTSIETGEFGMVAFWRLRGAIWELDRATSVLLPDLPRPDGGRLEDILVRMQSATRGGPTDDEVDGFGLLSRWEQALTNVPLDRAGGALTGPGISVAVWPLDPGRADPQQKIGVVVYAIRDGTGRCEFGKFNWYAETSTFESTGLQRVPGEPCSGEAAMAALRKQWDEQGVVQ